MRWWSTIRRSHWTSRLTATGDYAPLKGIENAGWKLAFAAKPTDLQTTREDDEKEIDLTASIGLTLSQEGKVIDVVPGLAVHKAGIGPGMKLIAVNGRRWSAAGMRTVLAATKNSKEVLQLLVENDDYFRTLPVTYSEGGRRYPRCIAKPRGPICWRRFAGRGRAGGCGQNVLSCVQDWQGIALSHELNHERNSRR